MSQILSSGIFIDNLSNGDQLIVESGGILEASDILHGDVVVGAGGLISGLTFDHFAPATAEIMSGGTGINNTVTGSQAEIDVWSGGVVSNTKLMSGGRLE